MMKNKLLVLLGVAGLALAGCSSGEETADTTEETTQAEEAAVEETQAEETETEETQAEETVEETSTENEIVIGEPIQLGDYEMTVTGYSLGTDYEGQPGLIIDYNWTNNSEEAIAPFMSFMFKGFQDGVETPDTFFVEGVDLETGQREVKPGGSIEGAQTAVGISDPEAPLLLELEEFLTFEDLTYSTEIDLSELQ